MANHNDNGTVVVGAPNSYANSLQTGCGRSTHVKGGAVTQQQMDLALGIICELLQFVPRQIPSDVELQLLCTNARRRAENFLKAIQ